MDHLPRHPGDVDTVVAMRGYRVIQFLSIAALTLYALWVVAG